MYPLKKKKKKKECCGVAWVTCCTPKKGTSQQLWLVAKKLFSCLDDLQCTAAFVQRTGVSIWVIRKKKKSADILKEDKNTQKVRNERLFLKNETKQDNMQIFKEFSSHQVSKEILQLMID